MDQTTIASSQATHTTVASEDNRPGSSYTIHGAPQPVPATHAEIIRILHDGTSLDELVVKDINTQDFCAVRDGLDAKPQWAHLRSLTIILSDAETGRLRSQRTRRQILTLSSVRFPELQTLHLCAIHLSDDTSLDKLDKLTLFAMPVPVGSSPDPAPRFLQMLQRSASTLSAIYLQRALPEPLDDALPSDPRLPKIDLPQIRRLIVHDTDPRRVSYFVHSVTVPPSASVTVAFPRGRTRGLPQIYPPEHPHWARVPKLSLLVTPVSEGSEPWPSYSSLSTEGGCLFYLVLRALDGDRDGPFKRPERADIVAGCPRDPRDLKEVEIITDWCDSAAVDALWPWLKANSRLLEHLIIHDIGPTGHATQLAMKLNSEHAPTSAFPRLKHIHMRNVVYDHEVQKKLLVYVADRFQASYERPREEPSTRLRTITIQLRHLQQKALSTDVNQSQRGPGQAAPIHAAWLAMRPLLESFSVYPPPPPQAPAPAPAHSPPSLAPAPAPAPPL